MESVADATRRCRRLLEKYAGDPWVQVYPAPHSPHAASPEMIQAGWRLAEETDTYFHIHVAEGQYEVKQIRERYGLTPMRWLESLGILGPRMVAVHCVWLEDHEIRRIGEAGAALAYNPASNMFLGDGVTRLPEMLAASVQVALGTDGRCSNNRTSIFDEMRTCSLLQKVARLDGAAMSAETVFHLGTAGGGDVPGGGPPGPGGVLRRVLRGGRLPHSPVQAHPPGRQAGRPAVEAARRRDHAGRRGGAGGRGGAVSADHLVYAAPSGLRRMAEAGVVAVLLPATTLFLLGREYAPAREMIAMDVPVALATDFNPGSSPTVSMALVVALACLKLGMLPSEAIAAATINAAHAIGRTSEVGSLEDGKRADLVVFAAPTCEHIPYHVGVNLVRRS